jgi:hypothetical protein
MAVEPPLFRALRCYPVAKGIARELWGKDLQNLADSSPAVHNLISTGLFGQTLKCDGSSGEIWKAEWRSKAASHFKGGPLSTEAAEEQFNSLMSMAPACQTQTLGGSAFDSSYACEECGEPVCNTCRARPDYASLFDNATVLALRSSNITGEMYLSEFGQQDQYRYERYCENCEPVIVEKLAQSQDGRQKGCECHILAMGRRVEIERLCVPCLKKRCQRSEGHHAPGYICTNRKKVPGCVGASRTRSGVCMWCSRFLLDSGRT